MKEFSIPLKNKTPRAVIELSKLPALIDTSSVIPIFSIFPPILEKIFEVNMILETGFISKFSGFERGSVYSIKKFEIGDLIFNDFEVFVPNEPKIRFPILLSATLFHGMNYEFDTINGKFIVRMKDDQSFEREFKIKDLDGKLYPQIDGTLIQDTDIMLHDFYFYG